MPTQPTDAETTSPTSTNKPVTGALPHAGDREEHPDDQAREEPGPAKPYVSNYDLWVQAVGLLKESERGEDILAIVEKLTAQLGGDYPNRPDAKSLAVEIREKIDKEIEGQQNDGKTRRIVENAVSVLGKFVAVGDVVVSFDPVHAALPWAAVRSVLVVSATAQ